MSETGRCPAPQGLEIEGLRKAYGSRTALDGVDLDVAPGEVLALLGPNGAGKTTLVSIVAGLRRADAGSVRVRGIDVARHPQAARHHIGLAPQETGVYLPLSVRDNLQLFAALAGLRGRTRRDRIDDVADALGLRDLLARRAAELSGGERRRLHTAIALVHRPALVLLDEPTTGADVRTRAEILDLVRDVAAQGSSVLYSTHYLHEVEQLDARVAVMDRGRVVARGGLAELVSRHGTTALELTFDGPIPASVCGDGAVVEGRALRIPTDDPARTAGRLLPRLGPDAGSLRAIEVIRPDLESVFLAVTGRRYDTESEMVGS
ncbi:MAG TPA: ABC transporter ATP-binding protein [Acidimicrobiia bacterium]